MNCPAPLIYIEPPAVMAARFLALLESRGLAYIIAWQWDAASKYRNGILIVHAAAGLRPGLSRKPYLSARHTDGRLAPSA